MTQLLPQHADRRPPRPLLGIAWMVASGILLAAMDAVGKWIVASFPVAQMATVRGAAALVLLMPLVWRAGGLQALATRRPGAHALRALVSVVSVYCFFEALRHLPLATTIAISFVAPLFMTALSVPILGERVGVHRWSAIAVGFLGVLVITNPAGEDAVSLPAMLVVVSALTFALGLVVLRSLTATDSNAAIIFYQNVGVLLAFLPLMPFLWVPPGWLDLAGMVSMAALLLVGQYCTVQAFRHATVGVVAPFQYGELLWAAIIGYLVFGEVVAHNVWLGSAIVVGSGLYVIWRERVRARAGR